MFLRHFYSFKKDSYYFFDPKHNADQRLKDENGTFEPHATRYQDLAKLIIALSTAGIAFLISILASDKSSASEFGKTIRAVAPIVIGFFGACTALLIFFMLLQTYWYEEYCQSADHNTFVRWKYALNLTLGWGGLLSFILGFVWLAVNLFSHSP
jgi:hypothetical protein